MSGRKTVSDPRSDSAQSENPHQPLVHWAMSRDLVAYESAVAAMEGRANEIAHGNAPELVWLLEHPPLYTAGTGAKPDDLLNRDAFPVHQTGRGGQFTYHGPGQRVAYVMLNIKQRFGGDVRAFTRALEHWIIDALARLGVTGLTIPGQTGVWVRLNEGGNAGQEGKIAAIGLRIRHGISFHGISLNADPDLAHYEGIVPCGLTGSLVTSLAALGVAGDLKAVDRALEAAFIQRFGAPIVHAAPPTSSGNPPSRT